MYGKRIQLTTEVHSLGHTHKAGDQGTVTKHDARTGTLIVRMDDGRTQFPTTNEVTVLKEAPR